jgi:hypothetical protein
MENPAERLSKILDLLGPNMCLELDRVSFGLFFGGELTRETVEIDALKLAKTKNCTVTLDGETAKFRRAYPHKEDSPT